MEELERLEQCSRLQKVPIARHASDDEPDLDMLKQKVEELRNKRNYLQKKIDDSRKYVRDVLNVTVEGHEKSTQPTATYAQLTAMKKQKLEELKKAYRFIGTSAAMTNKTTLRLCFDTCHKGAFVEPFYVELRVSQTDYSLVRHTLPHFVPLEALCDKLNASMDMPEFTHTVHAYLTCHMSRREECRLTQLKYKRHLVGNIVTTLACDYVEFTVSGKVHGCPLEVTLVYADLMTALPSSVNITSKEWDGEHDVIQTWKESLSTLRLSKAFEDILSNQTVN
ncbi:hypothetical protein NP493_338g02016 [Ridgeia piscesae]|uniref:Centromere protein O n=1 Tax=Ridgeia piscesae TaxID=27915 RepID=A0AAD9L568_RIDPI|nr:hypothetical protein NP493_338g02016 [Ridgeia piscesae]